MSSLLPQLVAGIATGGIYASLALALVMVYQATNHVNFAQGEMAMFSTFLAWAMIQAGTPYWLAFALTLALSFVIAALVELAVVRPLHNAPLLSIVVVFVGLLVIFHSLAGLLFGYSVREFPSPFPSDAWFGNSLMSAHDVGAIAVILAIVVLLYCFFKFTPLGLVMRAAAQNPASSRLLGINVSRMLMLGWGLAGMVGAVAGMLVAPAIFLEPSMMTRVLIYAFAGALVGGIDNPPGAVVGGFLVGILENLVGTYVVGTNLKLSVALVLIVGVLIVRPSGLMGRTIVTRV